jgi:hypothetical protein
MNKKIQFRKTKVWKVETAKVSVIDTALISLENNESIVGNSKETGERMVDLASFRLSAMSASNIDEVDNWCVSTEIFD